MDLSTNLGAGGPPAPLASIMAGDPARPVLTFYDDATGERVELSGTTLGNWVVKTANLLSDECELAPGDRAAVLLPPHWQTAAVLLGAWTIGLAVELPGEGDQAAPVGLAGLAGPVDVSFVAHHWLDRPVPAAGHRFLLGLAPLGAPCSDVPAGYRDYVTEVRAQSDQLLPYLPVGGDDPASVDGTSYQEWAVLAGRRADTLGLHPGDRLLVDAARHEHPVTWLLAPLAVGASVVLCANLDPAALDARIASERVSRVL